MNYIFHEKLYAFLDEKTLRISYVLEHQKGDFGDEYLNY